jgi:myo-inositol-1(or 4)-monophosphatase
VSSSQTTPTDPQLTPEKVDAMVLLVQEVFRRARPLILERAGKSEFTSKEHDGSPVTETDMEVEKMLLAEMAQRFPSMPMFGEETGYPDSLPATFWAVDPIDGTKAFIENVPTFTCMAVLIQEGEATASVIYNPSNDVMYVARKGNGAYKNDTRLDLSKMPLPDTAFIKGDFIAKFDEVLRPKGITCKVAPNGAGYAFVLVAEGQVAGRFNLHSRGYIHDYAPGALLVSEAGGVIIPVKDAEYTYESRSFVACHPELAQVTREHLDLLRELEASK